MFRQIFALTMMAAGSLAFMSAALGQEKKFEPPMPKESKDVVEGKHEITVIPESTTYSSSCCQPGRPRIVVECQPPEVIIQRAGGFCPPEHKGIIQRCGHFRFHQWTHMAGHNHGPVTGIPMMFAPQQQTVSQSMVVPQAFVQPQSYVMPQSFVIPQTATFNVIPQSFVMPQSLVQTQSFVQPQSIVLTTTQSSTATPQSETVKPQSNTAADSLEIRAAVKELSDNLKKASELIKMQTEILVKHENRIQFLEDGTKAFIEELNTKKLKLTIDGNNVKAVPR